MADVNVLFFGTPAEVSVDLSCDVSTGDDAVVLFSLTPSDIGIALEDGTPLNTAKWRMALYDQISTAAPLRTDDALGNLRMTERGTCLLTATLKSTYFSRLLASIQAGRVPNHFEVTVRGAEVTNNGPVWNRQRRSELDVLGVSVSTLVAGGASE